MKRHQLQAEVNQHMEKIANSFRVNASRSRFQFTQESQVLSIPEKPTAIQNEEINPEEILSLITSPEPEEIEVGLIQANKSLSQSSSPSSLLKFLIHNDIVEICCNLISSSDSPSIVNESFLLLEWLSKGDDEDKAALCENTETLELLIKALNGPVNYADKAAFILGNLAANSIDHHKKLLEHGIVDALVLLGSRHYVQLGLLKKIVWLMALLFSWDDLSFIFSDLKRLLPFVAKILEENDDIDILHEMLLTLFRISANASVDRIELLFELGFWKKLEKVLDTTETKEIKILALQCFGNMVPEAPLDCLTEEFMERVNSCLNSSSELISISSLRIIKLLTMDYAEHLNLLHSSSTFHLIYRTLSSWHEGSKFEAAKILYNCALHGSDEDIFKIFMENKIYKPLSRLLGQTNSEILKTVVRTLGCVQQIAQRNGFDKELEIFVDRKSIENLKALEKSSEKELPEIVKSLNLKFYDN